MFDLSPMISFIMIFTVSVMVIGMFAQTFFARVIIIAVLIGLIYFNQTFFHEFAQKDVAVSIMVKEQIPKEGSVIFTKEVRLYYFNGKLIHLEPVKGTLKKE